MVSPGAGSPQAVPLPDPDGAVRPGSRPGTFSERFCAQRRIDRRRYLHEFLGQVLYPHARLLSPLLRLKQGYFNPDYEFATRLGAVTSHEQFRSVATEYYEHPANESLLRGRLRLRASIRRAHRVVNQSFA